MHNQEHAMKVSGVCFIIFALLAAAVMVINAVCFSYPLQISLPLHQVITFSFFNNNGLRELMTLGSLLPLFLIPASIGLHLYLRSEAEGSMLCAHFFLVIAVLCWFFAEMLWPAFNWFISQYQYQEPIPAITILVISGINEFMHVYLGEYLRFTSLGLWMFLVCRVAYQSQKLPGWLCVFGIILAIILWASLIVRLFVVNPLVIEHAYNFLPIINLWIFLLGAFLIVKSRDIFVDSSAPLVR